MKKTIKIIILIILGAIAMVAIAGIIKFNFLDEDLYGDIHIEQPDGSIVKLNDIKDSGPHNTTYIIDGEPFMLVDGLSEKEITLDSASKIITGYFGNEVSIDLNGDGREDSVFLLTQETGGTGTFFYVVAALNTKDGWKGSRALFLGDRIAPQTTEVSQNPNHKNVIVLNYMDRADGQAMSEQSSIGKSIWLKFDLENMSFVEVEQNFEGEANPDVMTLDMKTWQWVKTTYNNDSEITPDSVNAFTITFKNDDIFSATTDCNSIGGSYEIDGNQITFGKDIFMTRMFCQNSQEQEFIFLLEEIQSFFFTNKGELIFDLKFDSGSSIFR